MLEGIKAGDRVVNDLGEEAAVTGIKVLIMEDPDYT